MEPAKLLEGTSRRHSTRFICQINGTLGGARWCNKCFINYRICGVTPLHMAHRGDSDMSDHIFGILGSSYHSYLGDCTALLITRFDIVYGAVPLKVYWRVF